MKLAEAIARACCSTDGIKYAPYDQMKIDAAEGDGDVIAWLIEYDEAADKVIVALAKTLQLTPKETADLDVPL